MNDTPTDPLSSYKRIVVKIGSSLLIDRQSGKLDEAWLDALVEDIAALVAESREVMIVSSGAIALGRDVIEATGRLTRLEDNQAAAAIGQIRLAQAWAGKLARHDLAAAQILLTLSDTERRRHYLNARSTLDVLLAQGGTEGVRVVPIINENDTVATSEIRYGDNDRLSARVAAMMSADCLILLSDVDGLYSAPPGNEGAHHIPLVTKITPEIEAMAGDAGDELSRGGMRTKIDAAKIATAAGAEMFIASGVDHHPIRSLRQGGMATRFTTSATPRTARKKWIAGHLEARGALRLDEGAVAALGRGKSLLPAGVVGVEGEFGRGDAVRMLDPDGREVGRGLIAYDSDDARRIMGAQSQAIQAILGYSGRSVMIHRNDLVPMGDGAGEGTTGKDASTHPGTR